MSNQDGNGKLSPQEINDINDQLKKRGILTGAKELIDEVDSLIPESRKPEKFIDDINK